MSSPFDLVAVELIPERNYGAAHRFWAPRLRADALIKLELVRPVDDDEPPKLQTSRGKRPRAARAGRKERRK